MLFQKKSSVDKRKALKQGLQNGRLLRFPGAFAPIVSLLIEEVGFEGVYISGAALSADMALPDIGLTTATEVGQRARAIARVTHLPSIVDVDTGFGEPMNAVRTIQDLEDFGLSGCHLEDQENPKRCGHLDHKNLVDVKVMSRKVKACRDAKRDENFLVIARTDARASEGLQGAIDRAKAYVDAGAEMIFPEALQTESEFEAFRKEISVPIMANMTEFGKSKLLSAATLQDLGYNLVIYPVTTLRLALNAVEEGLKRIHQEGHQESLLEDMQHRQRLYELLRYPEYNQFDKSLFNFRLD